MPRRYRLCGHTVFTALGNSVNVAARLQDMTKGLNCKAIVSEEVCKTAGIRSDALTRTNVAIRGHDEPMTVRTAEDPDRACKPAGVPIRVSRAVIESHSANISPLLAAKTKRAVVAIAGKQEPMPVAVFKAPASCTISSR